MRLGVEAAVVGDVLVRGDVELVDGRIAGVGLAGGGRGIAVPGFVDLQVNGFAGVDFHTADTAGYRRAGAALLETGVTAYLPTLVTSPEREQLDAIRAAPAGGRPRIVGLHLEGPFLSPDRLGAHDPRWRRDPDVDVLDRMLDAGPVRLMTLAPELPGAMELIDRLVQRGVTVSLGHTDATAAQAHAAFDRGARSVTHLFNAMRPFSHRDPGIAGAALARDDVVVSLIADGVHLAAETVLVAWRAARGRVALVTDAVGPTLGGAPAREGLLAGSASTMIEAVRNLHALGVPFEEAVAAATCVPASALGLEDVGRLDVGRPADVVVLTDRLEIERVLVGGEVEVAV